MMTWIAGSFVLLKIANRNKVKHPIWCEACITLFGFTGLNTLSGGWLDRGCVRA